MNDSAIQIERGQRKRWRLEERLPDTLRAALDGYSPMLCHLLYRRGYETAEAISAFFAGGAIDYDPFLLPDMDRAVDRILLAIRSAERIAIYGDFDCDGITAAVALAEVLRSAIRAVRGPDEDDGNPVVYIPSRDEGHGLHPLALAELRDQGVSLVVTADCGIAAIDEVQVARGLGMDVVITDHHEARADGSLPDAPVVGPTRHDSQYPHRFLCGAGLAYKLAQALARNLPQAPDPDGILDLVALGTIADVVPLRDENRSLVVRGLSRLRRTRRPGLLALLAAAGIDSARIDPVAVGFYLAPRINAANRLASPQLAYDLISATDPDRAASLARHLSTLNQQRQDLVTEQLAILMERVGPPAEVIAAVQAGERPPVLIEIGDWPGGISGLLAAKLVDAYGLPGFVGVVSGENVVSVSARGADGIHIDEILEMCEASQPGGLFLGYGGHARAGGFRVPLDQLDLATRLIAAEMDRQVDRGALGPILSIDAEVTLPQLDLQAATLLRTLAPFGAGFPEPTFISRWTFLRRIRPRGNGRHAAFSVQQRGHSLDGICFNAPPEFLALPLGTALDIVFCLQINEWNGRSKPELRLLDWRLSQGKPIEP
jgi:single-stranded-DNA-specific exonuclease